MKLLAYGILRDSPHGATAPPEGLNDKPVSFAVAGDLVAAYSTIPEASTLPDTSRVLSYARVVEMFHRRGAILPLRYGAIFASEAGLVELLYRRRSEFLVNLAKVEGRTEMGIRVLGSSVSGLPSGPIAPCSPSAGADYLAQRQKTYRARDVHREQEAQTIQRLRAFLEGLYADFGSEAAPGGKGPLSLYFLVSKDYVDRFVQSFRRLQKSSKEKMYLTGPWPPYNFVGGDSTFMAPCPAPVVPCPMEIIPIVGIDSQEPLSHSTPCKLQGAKGQSTKLGALET